LVSSPQRFAKSVRRSLIRARESNMLQSISAAKKVKPVRVNKIGKGVKFLWSANKTAIKQDLKDAKEYVLRSAVLRLVRV